MVVQIGRAIPRTRPVDLDACAAQFFRKLHRDRIERALRKVVAEQVWIFRRSGLFRGDRERTKRARDVDDSAPLGLRQQRQQRLGQRDHTEHVHVIDPAHGVERNFAWPPHLFDRDTGVVYQNVEPAEFGLDPRGGRFNRGHAGHIQNQRAHIQPFGPQAFRRGPAQILIPAAEQRDDALVRSRLCLRAQATRADRGETKSVGGLLSA